MRRSIHPAHLVVNQAIKTQSGIPNVFLLYLPEVMTKLSGKHEQLLILTVLLGTMIVIKRHHNRVKRGGHLYHKHRRNLDFCSTKSSPCLGASLRVQGTNGDARRKDLQLLLSRLPLQNCPRHERLGPPSENPYGRQTPQV